MTMNEDFTRGFFNMLVILRSYLSEIVIGGGWAPFLYYRYLGGDRNHDPLLTSDILVGLSGIQDKMWVDFETFSKKHAGWFRKFLSNLRTYFESLDSEGPLRIVEQRPAGAFPGLDDDQLKNHALGTLEQFIIKFAPLEVP